MGDESVRSFKVGQVFGRVSDFFDLSLYQNFVAKSSSELLFTEQGTLVKSKLFTRLMRSFPDWGFYTHLSFQAGHVKNLTDNSQLNRIND